MRQKILVGLLAVSISIIGIAAVSAYLLEPTVVGAPVAPDPAIYEDAVVQVYGADVWGFRGWFAIHTWIATKGVGEDTYNIYQVIGWLERRGLPVVSITAGIPDRHWWGSKPKLLLNLQGAGVDTLISRVDAAARSYPYANEYVMWPGPNSNSFTAWIGLEVEELGLELPWRAIGKGWMEDNWVREVETGLETGLE